MVCLVFPMVLHKHYNDSKSHETQSNGENENPEITEDEADSVSENETRSDQDGISDNSTDLADGKNGTPNDPADIPAENDETTDRPTSSEEEGSAVNGHDDNQGDPPPMGPYNFEPMFIFGSYEFSDHITREALTNLKNLYIVFMEEKKYLDMLDIPSDDRGTYKEILKNIADFDNYQRSNPDLLSADEYYQNALDRLFCYSINSNIQTLEQAAISAEAAVELENVIVSGSYNNFIDYSSKGIILFFCVLSSDQEEYDSGKAADVEYRIAKLLYRSSTNLLEISNGEKYYSLCCAYLVSRDAYLKSDLECNYAVDISYYHLKICSDMLSYIEDEEFRREIGMEALGVYAEFIKRIEESDKILDEKYNQDAEVMLNKINRILGYDKQEH